ncbi:MAG: LysM peptidoglycan-binding domain-containing protein [Candidatus Syntrophonatronum acetioxidans]|uniref:LysM peptidoglycan-binding domain-containing protein n=1 Tax=Candidatus Syntrophonatronum acetioxidans TaxID=1795816 RepID=A0A424YEW3_9FIRM|nr:MAG: LysM peptidoglycan-binding domain-containing protein [Candidatus Syntrophonatronum acetioxidans]
MDPEPDPEPDPKPEPQPENQPETDSRKEVPVPEERPSAPIIYPGQRLVIPGTHDATPSPSRVISQGTVEGKSKQIALTFDSGWLYEETLPLLKVLDQQGVKATFFPRALWVYNKDKPASSYPDLAREIVKRGHTMGNHSLTHPDMRNLSEKEIRYEIKESTAIIKNITGVRPYLFRPPYGAYDPRVLKILGEEGYPYTIMWTIDTHDWASEMRGQKVTEDYIVKRVLDNATNNGIVLMHIGGKYTVGALPRIIKGLRAKGYTFTTVDKMLPPPKREQYIYTVKSGDTLYRIAQNYGVTVEEIIKANNL